MSFHEATPGLSLKPKDRTLNRWKSVPPALYKGPRTCFSDWISMLEENARGRWEEQDDKS